jgi:hypothetical protein
MAPSGVDGEALRRGLLSAAERASKPEEPLWLRASGHFRQIRSVAVAVVSLAVDGLP